jgi:hypothetical protein
VTGDEWEFDDEDGDEADGCDAYARPSPPVCDPENRLVYLMDSKCHDCVFNGRKRQLALAPGRLKSLVVEIRARRGYLPCHNTYAPLGEPVGPGGYSAICGGFANTKAALDCDALIIGPLLGTVVRLAPPPPRRPDDWA